MATTRKQMYLEKIHDSSFSAPTPVTVEEVLMDGMSGDTLPVVTASDAGKGLVVDTNGKWVVGDIGGSSDGTIWSFDGTGQSFLDSLGWHGFNIQGNWAVIGGIDMTRQLFSAGDTVEYSIGRSAGTGVFEEEGDDGVQVVIMDMIPLISMDISSLAPSSGYTDISGFMFNAGSTPTTEEEAIDAIKEQMLSMIGGSTYIHYLVTGADSGGSGGGIDANIVSLTMKNGAYECSKTYNELLNINLETHNDNKPLIITYNGRVLSSASIDDDSGNIYITGFLLNGFEKGSTVEFRTFKFTIPEGDVISLSSGEFTVSGSWNDIQ